MSLDVCVCVCVCVCVSTLVSIFLFLSDGCESLWELTQLPLDETLVLPNFTPLRGIGKWGATIYNDAMRLDKLHVRACIRPAQHLSNPGGLEGPTNGHQLKKGGPWPSWLPPPLFLCPWYEWGSMLFPEFHMFFFWRTETKCHFLQHSIVYHIYLHWVHY